MKQLRLALLGYGLLNAIVIHTDTSAEVRVIGPGAGRFQAGQGMLADLIAIAKSL